MKSRITLLAILTLITLSSVHAGAYNYSFYDSRNITLDEWDGQAGTHPAVTSRSITVSNTQGVISHMAVGPKFVTSRSIMDCTFILIGPNNKAVILASNAGGSTLGQSSGIANIQSTSILFDDRAPGGKLKYSATQEEATNIYIPNWYGYGSYQTSAYSDVPSWYPSQDVALQSPINSGIFGNLDYVETLSEAFNGISANGTWTFLAYDNIRNTTYGSLNTVTTTRGWALGFNCNPPETGAVPEPAEWMLMGLCACGIVALKLRGNLQQKTL